MILHGQVWASALSIASARNLPLLYVGITIDTIGDTKAGFPTEIQFFTNVKFRGPLAELVIPVAAALVLGGSATFGPSVC
jgi:hypothetical protein